MGTLAKRTLIVILLLLGSCSLAAAGQVSWLNALYGEWNDAANWSSNPYLPCLLDDVVVVCPGVPIVNHNMGDTVINSLYCAGDLNLEGGSLTLAAPSQVTKTFLMSNSMLTADGLFTCSGRTIWSSGLITGGAGLSNCGSMEISDDNWFAALGRMKCLSGTTLDNQGTIIHTGSPIAFSYAPVINNRGLYDLQAGSLHTQTDSGQINNFGTFRKSGGCTPSDITVPFNNIGGKVEVLSGHLGLRKGGESTQATISIANLAGFALSGNHIFSGQTTVSGSGAVDLEGCDLSVTPSGSVLFKEFGDGLHIREAVVTCNGPVTNTGIATWNSGTISGLGGFTNQGALNIESGGPKFLTNGVINNSGIIVSEQYETIALTGNAVINNLAGGTWELTGGACFKTEQANSGSSQINNYGTFRKSATYNDALVSVPFNNLGGTIEVSQRWLVIDAGGRSTGGSIIVADGGKVELDGNHTVSGTLTASGSGNVILGKPVFTINLGAALISTVRSDTSDDGLVLAGTIQANGPITNAGMGMWTDGVIKGRGGLTNTGSLSIRNPAGILDGSAITNSGTIGQRGCSLGLCNSSTITNLVNGRYIMESSGIYGCGPKPGKIINEGAFWTTVCGDSEVRVPFHNAGGSIIAASSGTLGFLEGGTCSGGQIMIYGGHVQFGGAHSLMGTVNVSGYGDISVIGGELATEVGSVTNINLPDSGFSIMGGSAGGAGAINITGNFGLHKDGTLITRILGPEKCGKVQVSGKATLSGNLEVRFPTNYTPKLGDRFEVLTYGSYEGDFAHLSAPILPDGLEYNIEQGNTAITLVIAEKPAGKALGSIAAAKREEPGTEVRVTGVVTAAFDTGFYIEDPNHLGGIRVQGKPGPDPQPLIPSIGEAVTADGVLAVVDGNLTLTNATWASAGIVEGVSLSPITMNLLALGGSQLGLQPGVKDGTGLNNVGLLVRVAGKITYSGSGCAYIDDGSGLRDGNTMGSDGTQVTGVRIMLPPDVTVSGKFATITGICTVDSSTGAFVRALRVRSQADILSTD